MIQFFKTQAESLIAVQSVKTFNQDDLKKLQWLFSDATPLEEKSLEGIFIGPRREMITPWSTNAVEIASNLGLEGIVRMEEFFSVQSADAEHDSMLQRVYNGIGQEVFTISKTPESIIYIEDIASYNEQEGLALSQDEISYLE